MLLKILRYCRGYVGFTVSGKYPERFLNITARKNIRLWDVQRKDDGFTACMYRSDYRRIRPYARGAGVRLRVGIKRGLPTVIGRYRGRVGLVIGACAFILAVFVMSLFIWSIDITGLDTVSRTRMLDDLRDHGLYIGAFKPAIDSGQVAREIMLEQKEIGWMAVNITGSYASVEIKEEAPAPEVEDISTPCNIKAKSDGQILRIEAMEGETKITEGSGVIKGQLIVSGVRTGEQGASRLVHAQARVYALTKREASFSAPAVSKSLVPNGETAVRKSLLLFGLRIPYRFGAVHSPYSVTSQVVRSPSPLGITLPVGVVNETVSALEYNECELDNNSAQELLTREAQLYEAFSLSDCTVEDREYTLDISDNVYTLHVTYTCVEDIAYQDPIGTDENIDLTPRIVPTEGDE